jgi:hypothetical protein
MFNKKKPHIKYYTKKEGGIWIEMPVPLQFTTDRLTGLIADEWSLTKILDSYWLGVQYEIEFHALKFSNGEIWDCINGWRNQDEN